MVYRSLSAATAALLALGSGLLVCNTGCGAQKQDAFQEMRQKEIRLPNGKVYKCDVMMKQEELVRGMMFREKLPPAHGMLFVHSKPGKFEYFMYRVEVPLDVVWMNANREILEIVPDAQPCPEKASAMCPKFGGRYVASFVLELNAGDAARNGLQVGQKLSF